MLPVYVMHDSGLTTEEAMAILSGVRSVAVCIGRYCDQRMEVKFFGAEPWCEGEYSSADWYVDHTRRLRRPDGRIQLDADALVDLMVGEPWQDAEPHIDVMFVSQDLTAMDEGRYLNFVFGLADGRTTVQSVARFRNIPNEFDRFLAIKTVVQHELGHIMGMASDSRRSNTRESLGMHCTNPGCVMRQGLSVSDWVMNAREADQAGMIYCPQCLEDAGKQLIKEEIWRF